MVMHTHGTAGGSGHGACTVRTLEVLMAQKASYKTRGGTKDSAAKRSMNQPIPGTDQTPSRGGTPGTQEQDPKRRIGQFGGEGEPPLIKK